MDTIFAVSSGAAPAAIAVLRISGPHAFSTGRLLMTSLPLPRRGSIRVVRDPKDGRVLDRAMVLVFPGPRTVTGEDVLELHVHGGRAVVRAVQSVIAGQPNLRLAVSGEFTRRALMNGVIDLTEAEGLGDLLAAETEGQRLAALRMASGGVRHRVSDWSDRLVGAAAIVEAQLDFSDELDVPAEETLEHVLEEIAAVRREMEKLLSSPPIERLRDGIRVVIAGPPNSGKSTLLNLLAGRQAAIVSPISGTTRDRIEAPIVRDGTAYLLTDTAGLVEASKDPIERIGVELAREAIAHADLVIWLGDDPPPAGALWIHNKADNSERQALPPGRLLAISASTGMGADDLWALLAARAATLLPREDALVVNKRQRELLAECVEQLLSTSSSDPLLIAESLRLAQQLISRIGGNSDVEAVLDALFSSFCIGK